MHLRGSAARCDDGCDDGCGAGHPRQKVLPLGPIDRTYGDRLLVLGDAAGLVKPTTGGGIYYSLLSAGIAAEVLGPALNRDRVGADTLAAYESAWRKAIGSELRAGSTIANRARSVCAMISCTTSFLR